MKAIQTSGRRKLAIGRATLTAGSGKITVNGIGLELFKPKYLQLRIREPIILAGKDTEKIDIAIKVRGGGITGQADAARLVIARALAEYKSGLKETFLQYDRNLLVADVRFKEKRKPNTHGKARSKRQKSYR
jgi:small subunit ribosomal protein S9